MNAAERYAERIDAVAEQRSRVFGAEVLQRDRWSGTMARRFRVDPRRQLEPALELVASYVQPDDVFIDVGGGAGRVALPVALRCREAIVVDPSEGMQKEFEELRTESGITNARYVHAPWPAEGIEGDVTFAAHVTYFVRNVQPFIERLHAAARRRVAILVGSVPPPAMSAKLFRMIYDEDQIAVPGQELLLPVLWELGLVPEVHVLPGAFAIWTPSRTREDALQSALTTAETADNSRARQVVEANFDTLFTSTPEGYVATWRPDSKTVIITWEK